MKKEHQHTMLRCDVCDIVFTPTRHMKARWAVAGGIAILGVAATQNIFGGLILGGLGYGAAAIADNLYFSRRCPECGGQGMETEPEIVTPEQARAEEQQQQTAA